MKGKFILIIILVLHWRKGRQLEAGPVSDSQSVSQSVGQSFGSVLVFVSKCLLVSVFEV